MTFADLFVILMLVVLEGLLSLDNALVLAVQVKHLPKHQQGRALTWGMYGAVAFRILALVFVSYLMQIAWLKACGAAYLLVLAWRGLSATKSNSYDAKPGLAGFGFWQTVVLVEFTDIVFSIDSIMTAVGMSTKHAVVFIGGFLGIVMMRFAATIFVRLMNLFPRLERTAYWLVAVVGGKLMLELFKVDFHSYTKPGFWLQWTCFGLALGYGLTERNKIQETAG